MGCAYRTSVGLICRILLHMDAAAVANVILTKTLPPRMLWATASPALPWITNMPMSIVFPGACSTFPCTMQVGPLMNIPDLLRDPIDDNADIPSRPVSYKALSEHVIEYNFLCPVRNSGPDFLVQGV